jgi:hypothetical protein
VELRPLHSRSLSGNLAAEVGGFLVEFRVRENWDSAFPRAAVFVHYLSDGHSYRMIGSSGSSDLVVGGQFTRGSESDTSSNFTSIHVDEISETQRVAKVTLRHRPRTIVIPPAIIGEIFGGVALDGGGIIVINGQPHPVDPWGPLVGVLRQVVAYSSADQIADPLVRLAAKKSALGQIVRIASDRLQDLTHLERPPAPTRGGGQQ